MADGLYLVPVDVADKRGVVARAVLRSESGLALVGPSRAKGSCVELIDALAAGRRDSEVPASSRWARSLAGGVDREGLVASARAPVPNAAVVRPETDVAQGS